jgi:hypothetical protein
MPDHVFDWLTPGVAVVVNGNTPTSSSSKEALALLCREEMLERQS